MVLYCNLKNVNGKSKSNERPEGAKNIVDRSLDTRVTAGAAVALGRYTSPVRDAGRDVRPPSEAVRTSVRRRAPHSNEVHPTFLTPLIDVFTDHSASESNSTDCFHGRIHGVSRRRNTGRSG